MATNTDPYRTIGDQQVLDLWLTGFTAGVATAYDSMGLLKGHEALVQAQQLGHRIANDPAARESILSSVRQPPTQVRRGDGAAPHRIIPLVKEEGEE